MNRYALKIEYDGRQFVGWQRQKNGLSVQQAVEDALGGLEPEAPSIVAAGRTDAGVHALGQVAHCELRSDWALEKLREALNAKLRPQPVSVLRVALVGAEFSARFSAVERNYLYRVVSRRAPVALERGLVWHCRHELDVVAMREGARHLIGRHDFTTFRSAHCQAESPEKTLDIVNIEQKPVPEGTEYHLKFQARSFLHRQVRSFVGTLERVGAQARVPSDVLTALEARPIRMRNCWACARTLSCNGSLRPGSVRRMISRGPSTQSERRRRRGETEDGARANKH